MLDKSQHIKSIEALIINDQIEEAISSLFKLATKSATKRQLNNILSRHKKLKKKVIFGIISSQEETLEENRVRDSLLLILDSIDSPIEEKVGISNEIWKKLILKSIVFLITLGFIIFAGFIISKCLNNRSESDINKKVKLLFALQDEEMVTESQILEIAVKTIADVVGMSPNFKVKSVEGEGFHNIAAIIDSNNVKVILFNPKFMNELKEKSNSYWPAILATAHEMGKIINGTMYNNENKVDEYKMYLEAGYFAGFALGKLNAPLEETLIGLEILEANEEDTEAVPAKSKRLIFIEKGWLAGKKE